MKIYTKTGDKGETSLFGGQRVQKNSLRISAYGTIDELNSFLGIAVTEIVDKELVEVIHSIQNDLFTLGSDLASPIEKENNSFTIPRVNKGFIERLEKLIDNFDSRIPPIKNFILPGGTKGAGFLHLARTVCRRAEREVISLAQIESISEEIKIYLNRLSDLLFVLARFENFISNHPDIEWRK
ncbi:MAG: cob(I)yrinic acid a,c-diamide adenosyltransferase [Bacteroidota bacterium]